MTVVHGIVYDGQTSHSALRFYKFETQQLFYIALLGAHHWQDAPSAVIDTAAHQIHPPRSEHADRRPLIPTEHLAKFLHRLLTAGLYLVALTEGSHDH